MPHADDGTLHAYLDGELTPVEVGQLESHLAGCAGCRARLDEARALIERAARLLGVAVPPAPERPAPPLHQLRPSRPAWRRLRVPLAWAATIVLAVGLGWYAGTFAGPKGEASPPALVATAPPATVPPARSRVDEPAEGMRSKPADAEQGAGVALADRPAREESDEPQAPAARAPVAQAAKQVSRDQAQENPRVAAVVPAAEVANGIAMASPDEGLASRAAARRPSTVWPVIEEKSARDLLGTDPVALPGYGVLALRRNPGAVAEIVVEQEIASGVVVSLFERPINQEPPEVTLDGRLAVDSLAKTRANERLARFVGGLRVEISGPLPMDSLSKLLELIRP
jgi:hypothetical protein